MNKVFIGLILAVCVLGMTLVMLNNRLGRSPDNRQTSPIAEVNPPSQNHAQQEAEARAREIAEAAARQEEIAKLPARETTPDATSALPPPKMPAGLSQTGQFTPPPPIAQEPHKPAQKTVPPETPKPAQTAQQPKTPAQEPARPAAPPAAQKPETQPAAQASAQKPEQQTRAEQQKTATTPAETSHTATRFVVYSREKGATVRMGGAGKMDFNYMTLEDPNRVVVDLSGDWKFPPAPGIPKNDLVQAVRVGKNDSKTRIVIDLKEKPRKVQVVPFKDGQGLDVRVDK